MNYACAGHVKVGRYMGVHVMEQTSYRFIFVIQSRWHEVYCFVRTNGGELIIQSAFTKKTIRRPTTHSSNIAVTTRPFNEIGRNLTQSTHRAIPPKVVHRGLSFVGLQREYQFTNFDKQETIALLTCYSFLYM